MKILIPLYDLSYAPQVIAALQRKRQPINAAVILNVDSGPGAKVDPSWLKVINTLRGLGVELFGYVDLKDPHGKPRTLQQVGQDMADWLMYGGVKHFYDDYYKGAKIPVLGILNAIANPGEDVASTCGYSMIWEAEGYLHSKPSNVKGQAVYALNEPNYRAAMDLAKSRGVSYFYATSSHDNPQAYDHLPPYFNEMILAL